MIQHKEWSTGGAAMIWIILMFIAFVVIAYQF